MLETVLFVLFGLAAMGGAVWVILGRNVTWSALGLLINFCAVAVLYILLNAPFVALVQVLVYGGAIVVLFLFVVMLLSVQRGEGAPARRFYGISGAVLAVAFIALVATLLLSGKLPNSPMATSDNVQSLGTALYTQFLLPVEMVALLLLVAMVGVVMLAKKR
jgi:NADH-quinone oxidoreductase subunit J